MKRDPVRSDPGGVSLFAAVSNSLGRACYRLPVSCYKDLNGPLADTAALPSPGFVRSAAAAPDPRAPVAELRRAAACFDPAFLEAWSALGAEASEPNPFFEPWYLIPSLRYLDPRGETELFTCTANGRMIGLLPLRRDWHYYHYPIPNLRSWAHENCFLGAPLVAQGHERAFWRALLGWADGQAGAALFLHLIHLPLSGPLYAALAQVIAEQGRPAGLVHREDRAMLASELSPEAYLEVSLSGKKRKELRRQYTRLAELGELRFSREDGATGLGRWMDEFLALEHSGWKGSAGSALSSHFATESMFRDALAGAASAKRLERITLWLDDQPVAMLVNFLSAPGAFSYKTAFDERFARFSPGVLLQRENLDLLQRPGIAWCDSCAAADHPMIDHLWRERRSIGRISIGIGGAIRRGLLRQLLKAERGHPLGGSECDHQPTSD